MPTARRLPVAALSPIAAAAALLLASPVVVHAQSAAPAPAAAESVTPQIEVTARRRVETLTSAEVAAMRSKLAAVIRTAVAAKSVSSRFPKSWLFHRRWGKDAEATTHDGRPLRHETIAGRTTTADSPVVQPA